LIFQKKAVVTLLYGDCVVTLEVEKWVQTELNKVPVEQLARLSPSVQVQMQLLISSS